MSLPFKPDAAKIKNEIESLATADWLTNSRNWWPLFLFHYTNIENAVKILEQGFIYSRKHMEENGCSFHDGASPEIISQTKSEWKEYVRLFFRPRTPTLYSNEGFRPREDRPYNSHCPVPICFLFDSKLLLSTSEVSFSDGSLASSSANIFSTADEYHNLPFDKIFHDSSFSQVDKPAIIHHRQAEVIVKNELGLGALKNVFCRSEAEYRTLHFLTDKTKASKYIRLIGSSQKGNLFFKNWLFVEQVDFENGKLYVKCSKQPSEAYNFAVKFEISDLEQNVSCLLRINNSDIACTAFHVNIPDELHGNRLEVKIYFDDCLMFADRFESNEVPF